MVLGLVTPEEGGVALQKPIEFRLELAECGNIHVQAPGEAPFDSPELDLYQILLWRKRASAGAL
jgi:hypothetical protein